ncbi:hypothetical protein JTE90_025070 [Oedothorax gibbosus]|uniref:Uncharacterized protein n=1 Tax=Oedothorax gibbosus TaxID=931172 RepID=A0AAV6U620_9ARAC|nr:hypothetical protein JTE90_025070 [Oedothorax gibbosus]
MSMNTLKCSIEGIALQVAFSVIVISILIFYLIFKLFSRNKLTNLEITKNEISEILKIKTELMAQLKDLAVKTSTEGQLFSDGSHDMDGPLLAHLQERNSAVRAEMMATLEQNHANAANKFEELERIVEDFGKESLFIRDSLERLVRNEELYEAEVYRRLVEIGLQTKYADFDDIENASTQQESYISNSKLVLFDIKECMEEIVSSSKVNWENFILETVTSIKQYQKNLEEWLKCNIIENFEKMSQLQIDMLMAKSGGIEKQLLEISIFSDRKLVDVQVIEDILKFFNMKFVAFADKCQVKWCDSCTNLDNSNDVVNETKDNLIFGCSKMSRMTCSLGQQMADIKDIANAIGDAVQKANAISKKQVLDKANTKRIEKIVCVVETMKDTLAMVDEDYHLKLQAISKSMETPHKRLERFVECVEDLEFFSEFSKNIASRYENVYNQGCGEVDNLEEVKDLETLSMISGDGLSSCRFGESVSEYSNEVNHRSMISEPSNKNENPKESRKYSTLKRMLSALNDIIKKTAVELVEEDTGCLERKLLPTKDMEVKLKQASFNWSSVPSEVNLWDVSNDCLLSASTSEDEDLSVTK